MTLVGVVVVVVGVVGSCVVVIVGGGGGGDVIYLPYHMKFSRSFKAFSFNY